jgi:PAS domain S-box-containing protein
MIPMSEIITYFNPLARLGLRKYSRVLPLSVTILTAVALELIAYYVVHDPMAVGIYAIFLFVSLIIYFAFRDGIHGGLIATMVTIVYYIYIMVSRNYQGERLISGIETTIILGLVYIILAMVIGWLKQTLDVLMLKEIDARRLAEEGTLRLQTILEQLPVGVLMVEAKDLMVEGNKQVEKILGKKIKIRLQNNPNYPSTHAHRNNRPLVAKEWPIVRAIKKGEVITGEEVEYIRDDKKRIHLRVSAAPIRNKHRQIIAAVSTFDDITQIKDMEQRKDDFVNMASHELKTPITSMKLYLDSLSHSIETYGDERALRILKSVKNQTNNLQELVNDLLDVSRIQTGKLRFSKEEFRLDVLAEETIDMLQDTSPHQIVKTKRTPVVVYADRFRIYQVLTNLITNAIKYSPADKKIVIKVEKKKHEALVSVQDFGIGIAKEQQKKVFERLYQVTAPKEKTFPGLGMGLYISKEIIKRHHGAIWVEGEKDKGSTFYFTLPLKKK